MKKSRRVDDRPSMQFYPKDWLSDIQLQGCSYQAKGVWMDILCYMWLAPERGLLACKTMRELLKGDAKLIQNLLAELIEHDVCEITQNNELVSRKMHREYMQTLAISDQRRQAANARWHAGGYAKHAPSPSSSSSSSTSNTDNTHSSVISFLLNIWKSTHPKETERFGLKQVRLVLEQQIEKKISPKDLEAKIRNSGGSDLPPWEIFKVDEHAMATAKFLAKE